MIPAPPTIIECPHCSAKALKAELVSGNTFGATIWSDGKRDAPMLPDFPRVVKCRTCAKFYWVRNARNVGTLEFGEVKLSGLKYIEFPTMDEYVELLDSDFISTEDNETYVRTYLWWSLNDQIRDHYEERPAIPQYELFIENLNRLIELLKDDNPEDKIMITEIHREMGNFDKAIAILKDKWPDELADAVSKILMMADNGESVVFSLT